jgi:hypothetical protein
VEREYKERREEFEVIKERSEHGKRKKRAKRK